MYGAHCIGFVTPDPVRAMAQLVKHNPDNALTLALMFARAHTDDMGRDTIMYWPELRLSEREALDLLRNGK
jgi:hypothetical protein